MLSIILGTLGIVTTIAAAYVFWKAQRTGKKPKEIFKEMLKKLLTPFSRSKRESRSLTQREIIRGNLITDMDTKRITEEKLAEILGNGHYIKPEHLCYANKLCFLKSFYSHPVISDWKVIQYMAGEIAEFFKKHDLDSFLYVDKGSNRYLADILARQLNAENKYVTSKDNILRILPELPIETGEKVLLLESVLISQDFLDQLVGIVKGAGAVIVGIGVLFDITSGFVDLSKLLLGPEKIKKIISLNLCCRETKDCEQCNKGFTPGSLNYNDL